MRLFLFCYFFPRVSSFLLTRGYSYSTPSVSVILVHPNFCGAYGRVVLFCICRCAFFCFVISSPGFVVPPYPGLFIFDTFSVGYISPSKFLRCIWQSSFIWPLQMRFCLSVYFFPWVSFPISRNRLLFNLFRVWILLKLNIAILI